MKKKTKKKFLISQKAEFFLSKGDRKINILLLLSIRISRIN